MIEAVCNLINNICDFLSKFIPQPSFLGDIAAFYTAIIALAVPISIDIIARISERYQSEVIVKRFLQEREIKQLPLFLVFNIILAIVLKFSIKDSPSCIMWKVFAWIMFIGFFHIVYLLFCFIRKIKKYLSSIEFILEDLFVSAKNFFDCKNINKGQLNFVESLEGAGDILVFATKQINKNKLVIQELKTFKDIIKKFFEIKKNDPKKFKQMIYAQKFLRLYSEDPKEAKLRLALNPDEYLITFSTAVNQFVRIYRVAIEIKNEDISRFATYNLNWLLADIVLIPNNELFVELLLELLSEITRTAVERQDSSMYAASIHWYISIVFNQFQKKREKFDLSYLKLFDKYFFSSIRFIVSCSQTALFKNLVSSLIDGIHIPSYNKERISDYRYLIFKTDFAKYNQLNEKHNLNKMIKNLLDCENDLDSKEKLDKWLGKFKELKNILEPYFLKDQLQEAKKIEKDIKDYVEMQFKYNNLLEIIFAIGAYCLFKQKPEYIKLLWDGKQPSDSDANWVGHDLFLKTLPEIIYFYFKKELFELKFDFWEGHHGSEVYYKKYFLLLLMQLLQPIESNNEGQYELIDSFNLPDLHVYRLSDIEYSIEELIKLAKELFAEKNLLAVLGFDVSKFDELIYKKLILFLENLKKKSQIRIENLQREQPISQNKINEFKDDFLKEFNKNTVLKHLFKHYGLFKNNSNEEYKGVKDKFDFAINTMYPKGAFFDEWHVNYLNWGGDFGRDFSIGEDSFILDDIIRGCEAVKENDFEKTFNRFEDLSNIFILTTVVRLYSFFKKTNKFTPKWVRGTEQFAVNRFEGWYSFTGKNIPVILIYHKDIEDLVLILNSSKLGILTQYSPLNQGDNKDFRKEIFYMNIRAFSNDEALVKKILEKSLELLIKQGEEEQQKKYLMDRVLIEIFERFEYKKHEKFEGYRIIFGNQ